MCVACWQIFRNQLLRIREKNSIPGLHFIINFENQSILLQKRFHYFNAFIFLLRLSASGTLDLTCHQLFLQALTDKKKPLSIKICTALDPPVSMNCSFFSCHRLAKSILMIKTSCWHGIYISDKSVDISCVVPVTTSMKNSVAGRKIPVVAT